MQSEPSFVGKVIAGSASAIVFVMLVAYAQWGCDRHVSDTPVPQSEPAPQTVPAVVPPAVAPADAKAVETKDTARPKAPKSGIYDMKRPKDGQRYLGSSKSDPDIWSPRVETAPTTEAESK